MSENIRKLVENRSRFFAKLFEQLEYVDFIKSQSIEKYFRNKVIYPYKEFFSSSITNQRFEFVLASIDIFLSMIAQVTLFFVGAKQVFAGTFTVGNFFYIF